MGVFLLYDTVAEEALTSSVIRHNLQSVNLRPCVNVV